MFSTVFACNWEFNRRNIERDLSLLTAVDRFFYAISARYHVKSKFELRKRKILLERGSKSILETK